MSQEFWWKEDTGEVHNNLYKFVSHLNDKQSNIYADNLKFLKLYGNMNASGLGLGDYSRSDSYNNNDSRVTLNIIASMIDTVSSKITKNRPRPMFLTEGGSYKEQKKAEKLNKFVEGTFYKTNLYEKGVRAFIDACVFGTGFIKFYTEQDDIKCERVFPNEIIIDQEEAIYGAPRNMYQAKYMHKSVLKELFPKQADQIEEVENSTNFNMGFYNSAEHKNDMVSVLEAWHLPSSKTAKDGRHVIVLDKVTLLDEPYTKSFFPFTKLRWSERLLGFFGQGIAEQLQGIQYEINKILRVIQVAQNLVCIPKVLVESGSKIVKSHLNNEIGGIVVYSGTKPDYQTNNALPSEIYSHLERLYNKAYEIIGISQLSATSRKPSGLDSGVALREYSDIETERFMSVGRNYENFYLHAAKIILDLAKDLSDAGNEYSIKFRNNKFIEKIKFSEVKLDEDSYEMKCFPTAFLPSTPAGKLQSVQELLNAGLITKEDGLRLLEYPDLESVTGLMNSQLEIIDDMLEKMVDKGEYLPPEPYLNLQLALQRTQLSYMRYKLDGVDDERLELIRRFMDDISNMLQPPAPEMPPQMPPEMEQQMLMEQQMQPAMGPAEGAAVMTPTGEVI